HTHTHTHTHTHGCTQPHASSPWNTLFPATDLLSNVDISQNNYSQPAHQTEDGAAWCVDLSSPPPPQTHTRRPPLSHSAQPHATPCGWKPEDRHHDRDPEI